MGITRAAPQSSFGNVETSIWQPEASLALQFVFPSPVRYLWHCALFEEASRALLKRFRIFDQSEGLANPSFPYPLDISLSKSMRCSSRVEKK